MRARDIFGLIVRVVGLVILVFGLWYLIYALSQLVGVEKAGDSDEMHAYFVDGTLFVVVALYFLRGAPHLVRFCYPEDRDESRKDAS